MDFNPISMLANDINSRVSSEGKFPKWQVIYMPFSPPPVFWEYRCDKCRWWQPEGRCRVVEGEIEPQGWCVIWMPPDGVKPFTWVRKPLETSSSQPYGGNQEK